MIDLQLENQEAQNLMSILLNTKEAWLITHPLIVKLGNKLQEQRIAAMKGNSHELPTEPAAG